MGPHAGHILVRQCLVRGWCGTATKVCTHPVCSLARVLELTTITWDAGTTTESESDTLYIHNMEGGAGQTNTIHKQFKPIRSQQIFISI